MVNQQVLKGHWSEIQGKLRDRWGELTDDELEKFQGNADQLVGLIQRKTGETRAKIENYLAEVTDRSAESASQAAATVRQRAEETVETAKSYATELANSAQETAERAANQVKAGYIETERLVRRRPLESLAVCFGAGLITGVVVGALLRGK